MAGQKGAAAGGVFDLSNDPVMKVLYQKYLHNSAAFTLKTLETNCRSMAADLAQDISDQKEIIDARNWQSSETSRQMTLAGERRYWLRTQVQP